MAWRAGLWPAGRLLNTPGVKEQFIAVSDSMLL